VGVFLGTCQTNVDDARKIDTRYPLISIEGQYKEKHRGSVGELAEYLHRYLCFSEKQQLLTPCSFRSPFLSVTVWSSWTSHNATIPWCEWLAMSRLILLRLREVTRLPFCDCMRFFTFGNYKGATKVLMWSSEPTGWNGAKLAERVWVRDEL
jgi:hypothetical protein